MKTFTFSEIKNTEKKLNNLFKKSANLWENYDAQRVPKERYEKLDAKNGKKIDAIMREYFPGVKISYPGLYPSFGINEIQCYDVVSLINELYTIELKG